MTESEDKREAGQEQQVQIPARSASFNNGYLDNNPPSGRLGRMLSVYTPYRDS